jgi:hypothetical protein
MKNLQPKQVEAQECKHRKQTAGKTSAYRTHIVSGNPPSTDDLQKSRSALCEAGKTSHNLHARGQEGRPPACADHESNRRELHGPARWPSRPERAEDRNRKILVEREPTEVNRSSFEQHLHRPFSNTRLSPRSRNQKPLLAPTKTKQNKRKKKQTKQNSLHQCYTGRKKLQQP